MGVLRGLKPARVFYYFEEISGIPRESGNTGPISDYLIEFARKHELRYLRDAADNVIIFKAASPGCETAPAVILQGHCDMVAVKEPSSRHDFLRDGLKLKIDGDRITAEETSLGADDGIALAYCLAILESDEILHPPLEVVLTSNEEIGLVGASRLDTSCLQGKYLLNLDYSTEGTLLAGCAGGLNVFSKFSLSAEMKRGIICRVKLSGLKGGHSGIRIGDIHANACVLSGRLLAALSGRLSFGLLGIEAGEATNVIPSSSAITIIVPEKEEEKLEIIFSRFRQEIWKEYGREEQNLQINWETEKGEGEPLRQEELEKIICFLLNAPEGVQKMSSIQPGLVETSVNFGTLRLKDGECEAGFSIRSSVDHVKYWQAEKLKHLTQCLDGTFSEGNDYPAWEYQEESELRGKMTAVYEEMFGKSPEIDMVHAGLECGYFSKKIPDVECISFAPSMYEIHSAKEALDIPSTERMWRYLKRVLESFVKQGFMPKKE